jgi:hypothetical protein
MTIARAVLEEGTAPAVSQSGSFFVDPSVHFEMLRDTKYTDFNCASLSEVLKSVKVADEGDTQSWYTAWKATADLVHSLVERTEDSFGKGGTYRCASTDQRTAEILLAPDDPKRRESSEKTNNHTSNFRA